MISRVVEVSSPSRLFVRNRRMVVELDGEEIGAAPVEDIGVLILDNPAVLLTQRLLALCAEHNVAVIVCDAKHLPASLLLPFAANTLHTKVLREQIAVSAPRGKRLWQGIVRAKIEAQARLVASLPGRARARDARALATLPAFVRSGDPDNVEARAAVVYFDCLFGREFLRDPEQPGINAMLNYGYAVIRAAVARAAAGTGLHPALGIHHRNQYDPFCLADDLMEPLRPLVDAKVIRISTEFPDAAELTPEIKRALLTVLEAEVRLGGKRMPILAALPLYAADVRRNLSGEARKLRIPEANPD